MKCEEIAASLSKEIGRKVSRSQVSHARGYFGKIDDHILMDKFKEYYAATGKYPRGREAHVKPCVSASSIWPFASYECTKCRLMARHIRDIFGTGGAE